VLDDDDVTDTFIRAVAAEVKGHGSKYEQMLKEREKSNPKYKFMLERTVRLSQKFRPMYAHIGFSIDGMPSTVDC
jgi:U2-associated protein SR140